MQESSKKLLFWVAVFLLIAAVVFYSTRDDSRFEKDLEKARSTFEKQTRSLWGGTLIPIANLPEVSSFIRKQSVTFVRPSVVALSEKQRTELDGSLLNYLRMQHDGRFSAFLAYRACAPYSADFAPLLNNQSISDEIRLFDITSRVGTDNPLALLWEYCQFTNFRNQHFKRLIEKLPSSDRPTERSEIERLYVQKLDDFLLDFDSNREGYEYARIIELSTKRFRYDAHLVTTNLVDASKINMDEVAGFQQKTFKWCSYSETPEQIVEKEGKCTFVSCRLAVTTNTTDGVVPITLSLYWSPSYEIWLPYELSRNSLGGFNVFF